MFMQVIDPTKYKQLWSKKISSPFNRYHYIWLTGTYWNDAAYATFLFSIKGRTNIIRTEYSVGGFHCEMSLQIWKLSTSWYYQCDSIKDLNALWKKNNISNTSNEYNGPVEELR